MAVINAERHDVILLLGSLVFSVLLFLAMLAKHLVYAQRHDMVLVTRASASGSGTALRASDDPAEGRGTFLARDNSLTC